MATTIRHSHAARVRITPGDTEAASATSHIVVRHHRTPAAEWSIDLATGGHVLHLALAQCVFNNVLRIARDRGLPLTELSVAADGGFNPEGTASTGIDCSIELAGDGTRSDLIDVAEVAFNDSTVGAVLRRAGTVELTSVRASGRDAQGPAE